MDKVILREAVEQAVSYLYKYTYDRCSGEYEDLEPDDITDIADDIFDEYERLSKQ